MHTLRFHSVVCQATSWLWALPLWICDLDMTGCGRRKLRGGGGGWGKCGRRAGGGCLRPDPRSQISVWQTDTMGICLPEFCFVFSILSMLVLNCGFWSARILPFLHFWMQYCLVQSVIMGVCFTCQMGDINALLNHHIAQLPTVCFSLHWMWSIEWCIQYMLVYCFMLGRPQGRPQPLDKTV